ncbi:MAG: 3'-5' exonuclease [Burkholderiaceae bacterium]|nr:3'-5' exonuclease [Burkholderiaceae bacterium]
MTPVLVFDIETVPDVEGIRRLWALPAAMPDAEVAELAFERRREKTGSDFLPLHLHRVIAIAGLFRGGDGLRVRNMGAPGDAEGKLINAFYATVERYTPQLVSWNGSGFDLQVLHYRGLVNSVSAARYWEMGEDDREFRYNSYISRYHTRHLDLMDLLALYNGRANAPLDELARLCGFPGKLGMDGAQVWPAFQQGRIGEIRAYCETDVANTWLMYCRFQLLRGAWDASRYAAEVALTRDAIGKLEGEHWREFLQAWPDGA